MCAWFESKGVVRIVSLKLGKFVFSFRAKLSPVGELGEPSVWVSLASGRAWPKADSASPPHRSTTRGVCGLPSKISETLKTSACMFFGERRKDKMLLKGGDPKINVKCAWGNPNSLITKPLKPWLFSFFSSLTYSLNHEFSQPCLRERSPRVVFAQFHLPNYTQRPEAVGVWPSRGFSGSFGRNTWAILFRARPREAYGLGRPRIPPRRINFAKDYSEWKPYMASFQYKSAIANSIDI